MRARLTLSPVLALGLGLVAASARAQEPARPIPEALEVARSGDCVTAASLAEHLRAFLRRDEVDARIRVVVDEAPYGASFVVFQDDVPRATRRFDRLPGACPDRRAALAIVIAIAIDSAILDDLVQGQETDPGETEPEEPPPPPTTPAHPDEEASEEERDASLRVEVAAEGQVLVEVLPEVAAGWQLGPRLVIVETVELSLAAWSSSIAGADLSGGRVEIQLAGGRLDLCLRRALGVAVLRGCLGASGGAAFGSGRELPGARDATVPYVGLLGRAGVGFVVTDGVTIELAVDGWLALLRPRFDLVDDNGEPAASAHLPIGGVLGAMGLALGF